MTPNDENRLRELEAKLTRTTNTLASLIAWIAQSANSPITRADAQILLRRLEAPDA